jgi:HK97 gp10 family phage protein
MASIKVISKFAPNANTGSLEAIHRHVGLRIVASANILNERAAATHVNVSVQLAPVKTGFMKANIHYTESEGAKGIKTFTVHSPAKYSKYPEFGTVFQFPQPFFLPGYEAAKRQLREEAFAVTIAAIRGGSIPEIPVTRGFPGVKYSTQTVIIKG